MMNPLWLQDIFVIVLGLIFGSFTNVLIFRLPRGKSLVRPDSQCVACHVAIRWWDNIPVLSFILLRGKCRSCKTPISMRYPVVEILTALLFLAVFKKFDWGFLLIFREWPLMIFLVSITFIDFEHRLIPDVLSLSGLAIGLLTSWAVPNLGIFQAMLGAGFGFAIFFSLAWIYQRWFGRMGLGGGDIKLLAMLGSFLGPSGVISVLLISSITGSIVGILWAMIKKEKQIMKTSIPYGPFLVLGALFHYLLGELLWFPFMIQI